MFRRTLNWQGWPTKKQSKSLRQKGKTMKKWFLVCLMCVTPWALADGHSDLGLEKRQPDTAMNVTSVKLGQDVTSVSAEGDMDGYGKVYVTYDLSYNAARKGYASGRFQWFLELFDGVLVMRNVVNITNGQMNLDVIKFNPLTRELVVQAYILK